MRLPSLTFILAIFFVLVSSFVTHAEPKTISNGYSVMKQAEESDNFATSKIYIYKIKDSFCELSWEVSVPSEQIRKFENLTLLPKYSTEKKCGLALKEQFPFHEAIFNVIFKDWSESQFTNLVTSSLSLLDPSRKLNLKIALESIKSEEYNDYRRNYPNHKSGKHINEIMVDVSNSIQVYKELSSLFREHNLSIILKGVEKVFGDKVGNIKSYDKSFYDMLIAQGINDSQRILYDSGMFYFEFNEIKQTKP